MRVHVVLLFVLTVLVGPARPEGTPGPYVLVLGIAQDGGVPQTGSKSHPGWTDGAHRKLVTCLAIISPADSSRWLLDCTPDLPEQLHKLDAIAPVESAPGLSGIFLTHAHIGHYTGLMFFGHESMGARGVPVFAMEQMAGFLRSNGPWSQLVRYGNIELRPLTAGKPIALTGGVSVEPLLVPHRQEYSEVVGFLIQGPHRAVLFVPDIDRWELWDEMGVRVEDLIARVDVAYVDGTFFHNGEIPGRDMSGFPHPFITHSMERFSRLPDSERAKIRFIHLNHTNPALVAGGEAERTIEANGFRLARSLERVDL